VLGLDVSSTQKEVVKRTKEIINRLKIDDCPEFDLDLPHFKEYRTEDSIKRALQNLQAPKKKIKECFFWYQIVDEIDEKAFFSLKKSDYSTAIQLWEEASKKNNSISILYKKNLAILYCILLDEENNEAYLRESILLWKDIFYSEKFWKLFFKSYELNENQSADKDLLNEFKNSVPDYLSDIYTELHSKYQTPIYINEFQQAFSQKSEKMEKDVLSPVYELINSYVVHLRELSIIKDNALNKSEMKKIKPLIQSMQAEFNKLIDLGLYDDSQTKILRDKAVEAIRRLVLKLYNNLNESKKATALLEIALQIVGTTGLEEKIKQDIKKIEEMEKNLIIIQPVIDLIEKQKYEDACNLIQIEMVKHANNHELLEDYITKKKRCIYEIAIKKWLKADELFSENPTAAALIYIESSQLIYDNIYLFDFNTEAINNIIAEIKEVTQKVNAHNLDQLDKYRNKFVKAATEKFEGTYEETIFIVLIDGYIFSGVASVFKAVKRKNANDKLVSWVVQIAGWGAFIAAIIYFGS